MENVNISLIYTYQAPDWPRIRRAAFSWGMILFGLLDLILLFWLLNPFVGRAEAKSRMFADETHNASYDIGVQAAKPSPLGPVVVHKTKSSARNRVASAHASVR